MYTIDRINRLCNELDIPPHSTPPEAGGFHETLDRIDAAAGLVTTGGRADVGYGYIPISPVGARLARHERRIWSFDLSGAPGERRPAYFHLGADAEGCTCSCHK